jgi:hypothetical protein
MNFFIKFPVVYDIHKHEASTVAEILVTTFFCRFGVPREILSDQGRNVDSSLLQKISRLLRNFKRRKTLPISVSEDTVEGYVSTMKKYVRILVSISQKYWNVNCNTSRHFMSFAGSDKHKPLETKSC